jgi:hypothetical protein
MKRKGAEGLPARPGLTPAANDEFTGNEFDGYDLDRHDPHRRAAPRSGWDPYEVWRTRVKASAKEKRGREPLR